MISFNDFKKYITYCIRKDECDNKIADIFHTYNDVYCDAMVPIDAATSYIIELLEDIFELPKDEWGYTTLSWWAYETDYGKDFKVGDFVEESLPDDNPYKTPDLSTLENLYEFLVWESQTGKEK